MVAHELCGELIAAEAAKPWSQEFLRAEMDHLRSPDDRPDLDLLAGLVTDGYEWYVESHAPPQRRADVLTMIRA